MLLDENKWPKGFKLKRRLPFIQWEVNVFLLQPGNCVGALGKPRMNKIMKLMLKAFVPPMTSLFRVEIPHWVEDPQEVGNLSKAIHNLQAAVKRYCSLGKILLSKLYFKTATQQLHHKLWRQTVKALGSDWGEEQGLVLFLSFLVNFLLTYNVYRKVYKS